MYIIIYPNFGSFFGGLTANCSGKQSILSISIKKLCFTVIDSSVCDAQDGPSCHSDFVSWLIHHHIIIMFRISP